MCKQPLWINLPSEITINILLRLPIKAILRCKCVCKLWLELLSTPEFAKSHLSISTPGLAVQQSDMICKIFEFEDVLELQHHNLHYNPVMEFTPSSFISSTNVDDLCIYGSVKGFLFLYDYNQELDTLYICNPITREYIPLPKPQTDARYPKLSQHGFGVSTITGQYKVVRILHKCPQDGPNVGPCSIIQNYECLVYTVGTESWRSITPGGPFGHYQPCFSVFLNGNLHGLVQDYCGSGNLLISCFDLETELFNPFPLPPPSIDLPHSGSLGVLDDCLCFSDYSPVEKVVISVMKEYGVEESWTKQFVVVDTLAFISSVYDGVIPIKVFKDGDILLEWEYEHLVYYCNRTKTCHKLDFIVQNDSGCIVSHLHNSSFISLKSLGLENVKSFS